MYFHTGIKDKFTSKAYFWVSIRMFWSTGLVGIKLFCKIGEAKQFSVFLSPVIKKKKKFSTFDVYACTWSQILPVLVFQNDEQELPRFHAVL